MFNAQPTGTVISSRILEERKKGGKKERKKKRKKKKKEGGQKKDKTKEERREENILVSQRRVYVNRFRCRHTEIQAADQTCDVIQSHCTDTVPAGPGIERIPPDG